MTPSLNQGDPLVLSDPLQVVDNRLCFVSLTLMKRGTAS